METQNLEEFPRTKHLISWSKAGKDDQFAGVDIVKEIFQQRVLIEEKVDGTNIGISIKNGIPMIRNRSKQIHLSEKGRGTFQLSPVWNYCYSNIEKLQNITEDGKYILFGEWLYVRHTIPYDSLPSYFISYALFDRSCQKFVDKEDFLYRTKKACIDTPAIRWDGKNLSEMILKTMLKQRSTYVLKQNIAQEGIVLYPLEGSLRGQWFKIVRADFEPGAFLSTQGSPILNEVVKTE
jgi:hypothetical protein